MKQNLSPATFVGIIVVVVAIVGLFMWRVWRAPSVVPAGGTQTAKAVKEAGGIPPEAMRARDDWKKTHPEGK